MKAGGRAAWRMVLIAAAALASVARCAGAASADPAAVAPDTGVSKTFEGGPLRVDLRLDRASITVAERLRLTLTASVATGHRLEPWSPGESLGQFSVVSSRVSAPALTPDGRMAVTTEVVLEPFLPGEYEAPPIEVGAVPIAPGEGEPTRLTTEPIHVTVRSVLPEGEAPVDVAALKGVAAPPASWVWAWWAAGAVAAVGGAVAMAFWLRRRRAATHVEAPAPPHERALERLRLLIARRLPEQGEFKEFYNEVSDILRRYIEDRFGLRAPERTTEEFLREAAGAGAFGSDDVRSLREFLQHCDMVKFAEERPGVERAHETAEIARAFVERTWPIAPPAMPASSSAAPVAKAA